MKVYHFMITLVAAFFIAGSTAGIAHAGGFSKGGHGSGYCTKTARILYQACYFDVLDDYNETRANCTNVVDEDDRQDCFAALKGSLRDEWEGCRDQKDAREDVCDLIGEARYADPLMDPDITFIDPDSIGDEYEPNQYLNMTVGHTYVLRAGEDFEETVIVHVTDEVREAEGADEDEPVLCRVVVDAVMVFEEDEDEGTSEWVVDELTDDYFAQDDTGIVYYCGEISRNYEDDYLDNLDGSFFSGVEHAKAGVLMRQAPEVGQVDRQEYAIAEAEDLVEYLDLNATPDDGDEGGENLNDPSFACAGDCLKTFDSSALDPESTEFKYYKEDIGFVLATSMQDGEFDGEREELVCVGDSLDILSTPACGLSQVDELLEKLCELSPQAFCTD